MGIRILILTATIGFASMAVAQDEADHLATSLHGTRSGKEFWYSAANGGFEKLTGVGIEALGCKHCHGASDADGNPYPEPFPGARCIDCHASRDNAVTEAQCLGCHGRRRTESAGLKLPDVHREAGMVCWQCHPPDDLHGDGTRYQSMLEPGAIKTDCSDCHDMATLSGHADHDPHQGALHCSACHTRSVVSCYNCHFESQIKARVKRAAQPIHDFMLLVNRAKDGKVYPATFQSLTYDGKGFVAFAPYSAHAIVKQGRRCSACHVDSQGRGDNAAILQYNREGSIRFSSWDADTGTLTWIHGVVPVPADYQQTLRMELLTFDGDPASPPGTKKGWRSLGKQTWDESHMLFASPLTRDQMNALGFKSSVINDQ